MSGDVVDTVGGALGAAIAGPLGLIGGSHVSDLFKTPKTPTLSSPNALSATPTRDDAARAATRQTLDSERLQFSTAAVLTGGAGVLDSPTTTSRTLLGS